MRLRSRSRALRCLLACGTLGMALALGVAFIPENANAQRSWRRGNTGTHVRDIFPGETFTFCRVRYTSVGGWGRGDWSTDYPESDRHFSLRLEELTSIRVNKMPNSQHLPKVDQYQHAVVDLTDDALFNYPFLYMLEVGRLQFSQDEIERLRSYLLRGGFLMVDDFWGTREWANWEMEIGRVLDPEIYPMKELELDHPIFNMVFELKEKPQVPSLNYWYGSGGDTSERQYDSREPHYLGIEDPETKRLMVLVCHNTDLGDGWERETENKGYFDEISSKWAYPLGINIVVYAMTH